MTVCDVCPLCPAGQKLSTSFSLGNGCPACIVCEVHVCAMNLPRPCPLFFFCSFVRLFVCPFAGLFVCSFVRLFVCSFVRLVAVQIQPHSPQFEPVVCGTCSHTHSLTNVAQHLFERSIILCVVCTVSIWPIHEWIQWADKLLRYTHAYSRTHIQTHAPEAIRPRTQYASVASIT